MFLIYNYTISKYFSYNILLLLEEYNSDEFNDGFDNSMEDMSFINSKSS